jgi:1-acyl-sn-glycerol-3-phosphate acyltransferase
MLDKILYRTGQSAVGLYAGTMLKLDVVQHAPLPVGPKIIAVNHPTTTDPILMMAVVPEQMSILITEMVFKVPAVGQFMRLAGHIPVVAGNGRAAFDEALRLLEAGRTVGIFPEGALSPLEGGVHRPHTGAARLALSSGAPIIPVGIHLQRERIYFVETTVDGHTEVARWYLRGPYSVTIGQAMVCQGDVENRECVRAVSERVMERIAQLARESSLRVPVAGRRTSTRPVRVAGLS